MKEFSEVHSEQDLLSMFEKNSKTKVVDMFISYCDPSEPFEPIKEWHSDVQMQDAAKNIAEDEDRGPPKKKAKKTKTAESSIVPLDNEAPATSMSFPPSQNLTSNTNSKDNQLVSSIGASKSEEITSKKMANTGKSSSGASKRHKKYVKYISVCIKVKIVEISKYDLRCIRYYMS
ncbi:uncharacterized protein C2845_PM15G03130 [Panicum miliaceum]|uniref:Uncharacterized protein n=1 Tax=Panicum miliaceum TaxID=4540 RepID=A0A3L6Q9Z7_PANMI|nr:uncharacterized protein C2845_PM15G03130 [Panicum miliaceum]